VSANGTLVYTAGAGGAQLTWLDRAGQPLGVLGSPGVNVGFSISPDGKQVALQRDDGRGGADIWLLDTARSTALRFTSDRIYHAGPIWAPDGMRIAFFAIRDGRWQLWAKASNGAADEQLLLKTNTDLVPQDWSPDGRFLLYGDIDPRSRKGDLSMLLMRGGTAGKTESVPFVHTPFDENFAEFSPDGRWVVYQSDESGRYEVYVRPVAADGRAAAGKWQISTNGGIEPKWSRGAKEILYIGAENKLTAVDIKTDTSFDAGMSHALFSIRPSGVQRYDVSADGQRFLVSVPTEATSTAATVVLNWQEELKRLARVK
jgi:Tol biopolymer transport system component